ncbi:MFS transporter [Variovorax sp. J22P168]|uniref:MFS transporter n=1 Tax=Variovorax jilinensis TaxID=3053513 RepID=UPI002574CA7C|nr:MFS transporter [Variovorax sp. J22P168]MDM0015367.1 MFS transporter [Variovorax sp. J22P168]
MNPTVLRTSFAPADPGDYLVSRRQAWFAFAMSFGLMLFDYIDRQVIVSLFPYIKSEWQLSDKQLGALVSIISIVVALGALPVALLADRVSRVKSVFVMATVWSLASISCMFTTSYAQMLAARAVVGAGEAGYGSVGAALISTLFPKRLRGALLGAFVAAASLGSVLGVLLGGVIAARWGWRAAFGVVGVPGLVLALLFLFVRDYKTVELAPPRHNRATRSLGATLHHVFGAMARTPTMRWVCIGAAMQLIVVSAMWSWLPSYLSRSQGIAPDAAGIQAAMVVLLGALGSVFWGWVSDRLTPSRPTGKLPALAVLCLATMLVFLVAFAGIEPGALQFKLVLLGGFFMTCTAGVAAGVVIDVIHPGMRATGAAVLALFQNLFGLAAGPFLVGVMSDLWGLQQALAIVPCFSLLAGMAFLRAARTYRADVARVSGVAIGVAP